MADLLVRPYASGYMVAEPRVREYTDGLAITGYRARYYSTASAAARAVERRLESQDTPEPSEGTETKRATHRQPNPDRLKPQALHVLNRLILMRGLTQRMAMEMSPPVYRLSGRIHEIREEFGHDAVETIYQTSGGSRYALYRWRGPDSVQIEIGDAA